MFVGDKFKNNSGKEFEVVEYRGTNDVDIKFVETGFCKTTTAYYIRQGRPMDNSLSVVVSEGDVYKNTFGTEYVVVKYQTARKVHVRFLDEFGYETVSTAFYVKKGVIRNPYDKTVFSRGYYGVGPYKGKTGNKTSKEYSLWGGMFNRCYCTKPGVNETYRDCSVSPEFFNFQDFAVWATKQNGFGREGWHLDKDIVQRGNKVYSPETCAFVPQEINTLFVSVKAVRGNNPIGVNNYNGRYRASMQDGDKQRCLGHFDTDNEAFLAYKIAKEKHIKNIANKWRDQIDPRVYDSLMDWKIEITD